jgi:hypothetical protein
MLRLIPFLILTVGFAAPVAAATYSVIPELAGAFSDDGSFTPIAGYDPTSGQPALLQIDFTVVADTPIPTPYVATIFNIELAGELDDSTVPGFQKTPLGDCPSGFICPTDPIPSDPLQMVQTYRLGHVGTVFLDYAGGAAEITTAIGFVSLFGPGVPGMPDPSAVYLTRVLTIGVPEPTALLLVAVLGTISVAARRK